MLRQKVIQAISKIKEIPESDIRPESTLEALEVDSLDAIEIIFEIEEEYDIKVPTENVQNLKTVQDVIDGIAALLADEGGDGSSASDADDPSGESTGAQAGA